ncbi:MAG: hypothetical protein NWP90_04735, partial [Flavobacterium sp.]|nr:hypothetical protein [Flavobacterium sp.]
PRPNGSATYRNMVHIEHPRDSAALISSGGVRLRTSAVTDVTIGIIMIANTTPAMKGVPVKFPDSLANIGAFVAGDKDIIDYLKYNLRSQMFAKALPMIQTIGSLKRLELLRNSSEIKDKLWVNVNALQSGLKEKGFNIGDTNTCITPVYLEGSIPEAMIMVNDLRENYGIFLSIVVYPVIPKGIILLRMIPTASHTIEDINETLTAFEAIREKLVNGTYAKIAEASVQNV